MWLCPTGGLPASSSTATTDVRGSLRKRWKAHSASSPREEKALEGALGFIAARGGGTVDGYPKALPRGKPYSSSFIWGGSESMYAKLGFCPVGALGRSNRVKVMRKVVRGR